MPDTNVLATPGVSSIATKTTIPGEFTLTGTFTTVGLEVTGIGTLFTSEIIMPTGELNTPGAPVSSQNFSQISDVLRFKWLYDKNQNVVREIDFVRTDLSMVLKEAFPIDVGLAVPVLCPDAEQFFRSVSLLCDQAGSIVDGTTIVAGSTLNFDNEAFLDPIAVDGSVGAIQVLTKE